MTYCLGRPFHLGRGRSFIGSKAWGAVVPVDPCGAVMIKAKHGCTYIQSVSGLVVKSIVAIDGPRVRFAADALFLLFGPSHVHTMMG